ncbi:hypothetical protein F4809DRAFT_640543 [Biscogniauxia mediterranea]|nr:hypothetical protein F4809DRAFT_640543 [Biscogniauxia mediterranea]
MANIYDPLWDSLKDANGEIILGYYSEEERKKKEEEKKKRREERKKRREEKKKRKLNGSAPEDEAEVSDDTPEEEPSPKRPCRLTPFRRRPNVVLKTGCVAPTTIPKPKSKRPRSGPHLDLSTLAYLASYDHGPLMFLTLPTARPDQLGVGKTFTTHNKSTILAADILADHNHKYGNIAMPDQAALKTWLEENKCEFVRARLNRRAAKQSAQRLQVAPRPANADNVPVPVAVHPAARPNPPRQPIAQPFRAGIVRRARMYCRQVVEGLATRLNSFGRRIYTPEDVEEVVEGDEMEVQLAQVLEGTTPVRNAILNNGFLREHEEMDTDSEPEEEEEELRAFVPPPSVAGPASSSSTSRQPHRYVEPVMPPLDARFFHQDGRLHSVFKYLTAQIPLPRQWVKWAESNGVNYVEGRGDLRRRGTYIADDTFDYDALYRAIQSGRLRTGRPEIDNYPDYWPMVMSAKDRKVAHFDHLSRYPPRVGSGSGSRSGAESGSKTREDLRSRLAGAMTSDNPPVVAGGSLFVGGVNNQQRPGTFGLPADFYDGSSESSSKSSSSDSDSSSEAPSQPKAASVSQPRNPVTRALPASTRQSDDQGGRPPQVTQHRSPPQRRSAQLQGDHKGGRPPQVTQRQTPLQRQSAQLQGDHQSQSQPTGQSQLPKTQPHERRDVQPLVKPPQPVQASVQPSPGLQQQAQQVSRAVSQVHQAQKPAREQAKRPEKKLPRPAQRQPSLQMPLPVVNSPLPPLPPYESLFAPKPLKEPQFIGDVKPRRQQQSNPAPPPPPPPPPPPSQPRPQPPRGPPAVMTPKKKKPEVLNPQTESEIHRLKEQLRREEQETRRQQRRERRRLERQRREKEEEEKRQRLKKEREDAMLAEIERQETEEADEEDRRRFMEYQRQRHSNPGQRYLEESRNNLRQEIAQIETPERRKNVPSPLVPKAKPDSTSGVGGFPRQ